MTRKMIVSPTLKNSAFSSVWYTTGEAVSAAPIEINRMIPMTLALPPTRKVKIVPPPCTSPATCSG